MHGLIANMIVSAGRTLLSEAGGSAQQPTQTNPGQRVTPFSKVMDDYSVKNAQSIQEILAANPAISNSELLEISQGLKFEIVQEQKGLLGERAPLSTGDWTFAQTSSATSPEILKISDSEGKSMQIAKDSPIYAKAQLVQQIQDYLSQPPRSPLGL